MSRGPAHVIAAGIREYIGSGDFNSAEECILELAAEKLDRLDWTPCDHPYADCTVCKGTGKVEEAPCSVCVWKRWAETNCKTLEELAAERDDDPRTDTPKASDE